MNTISIFLLLLFTSISFAQEQLVVFFDSNKFETNKKETKKLNTWIKNNPNVKIIAINGYTDEDGSFGFNDSLANKRVNYIHDFVKKSIKTRDDFQTRSFGENFEQSKNKAENRKVTLFYLLEKDLARENEILGIKEVSEKIVEEFSVPVKEINYPQQVVFTNPDGSKSEFKLDVNFMKQVTNAKAGEKLKIENLNFIINTFAVANDSRGKLYELLLVMKQNPILKIEVQGHLCCMLKDRTDLSTQRAKYIANFLRQQGIERERVTYQGFGSNQPIYTIPEKNEAERAANRRVEVLIIEN